MRHELSGCVESASTTFSCVSVSAETGRNLVPHREGSDQRDASPGGLEARWGPQEGGTAPAERFFPGGVTQESTRWPIRSAPVERS